MESKGVAHLPRSKNTNKRSDDCNKMIWKASFAPLPKQVLKYYKSCTILNFKILQQLVFFSKMENNELHEF